MKFSEYIASHQVFTTSELMEAMDSPSAAEQQLRLAVRSGAVERARRGLLVSNSGRFEGAPVDPYDIAAAADPKAVLSYHSALEAHGIAHNASFACQFRSDIVRTPFEFRGLRYEPCGPIGDAAAHAVRGGASRRVATTREQTVVDCLGAPARAGGFEEVVRSLSAFAYLDVEVLVSAVSHLGPSMAARVGWLLSEKQEDWHVSSEALSYLKGAIGAGPYRFAVSSNEATGFSAEWRLILPDVNEEVDSWITRL